MIRCVALRGSSTARLHKAAHRGYAAYSASTKNSDGQLVPTFKSLYEGKIDDSTLPNRHEALEDASSKAEEDLAVSEARIVESKSWNDQFDPPSHGLPLSPLMDPEYIAAKSKYHTAKLPPSDFPTEFQKKLARNPYARMLDTPTRYCQVTKVNLPNFFLQSFKVMAHPVTKDPWQVPTGLSPNRSVWKVKEDKQNEITNTKDEAAYNTIESTEEEVTNSSVEAEESLAAPNSSESSEKGVVNFKAAARLEPNKSEVVKQEKLPSKTTGVYVGPTNYTLARQDLLRHFTTPGTGYDQGWRMLSSQRLDRGKEARKIGNATKWRGDMDTFVLELMRRRLKEHLWHLTNKKRGYVAGSQDWAEAIKSQRQAGAVLWLGPYAPGGLVGDGFGEQIVIPEFATLERGENKKKIAVHNLRRLLGAGLLAELRAEFPVFRKEIVILRDRNMTTEVRMRLWKLEGYLATWGQQVAFESIKELPGLLPDNMEDFDLVTMAQRRSPGPKYNNPRDMEKRYKNGEDGEDDSAGLGGEGDGGDGGRKDD